MRSLGWVVAGIAIVWGGLFLLKWRESERQCRETEANLNGVRSQLERMLHPPQGTHDSFWYNQAMEARENQSMLMNSSEVEELKRHGLANPVQDLRQDLMKHRELIPFESVEGPGGMRFLLAGDIALLNTKWVFARFEDGMIGGSGLFEYQVSPGGKIVWERIDARLY